MGISQLQLTDFRNHHHLDLTIDNPVVIVTGGNGSGKTNLLEALSLLVPGRGLRGAPFSDMARRGGPGGFAISAQTSDVRIGVGAAPGQPNRRESRINGAPSTTAALGEWLAMVWVTPAMDRLFVDAPSGRRRFLDRLVLALDAGHAVHSSRYERALRERNRLLGNDGEPDPQWLDALEGAMAEHGSAIIAARLALVAGLREAVDASVAGDFAVPLLSIDGSAPASPDALAARLRADRSRDRAAGLTRNGPHRSDLIVTHAAKTMPAASCSTGEQKALLLAVVLAHAALVRARRGAPPVLLLDEVTAHLDADHRASLFQCLADNGGQCWMTGTDVATFAGLGSACRVAMRLT